MYNVPTIDAKLYTGHSDEGSTRPYLMECGSERDEYYVKLKAGSKGSKKFCVKELVCGLIAKEIDLEIPDFAFVNVDAKLGDGISDSEASNDIARSAGLNFGSRRLYPSATFRMYELEEMTNSQKLHNIIAFDAYIMNDDRRKKNPNLIIHNKCVYIIDHGYTLPFMYGDDLLLMSKGGDELARLPWDKVQDHPLYEIGKENRDNFDIILDSIHGIGDALLEQVVNTVPDEWFERTTDRTRLYDFLKNRKNDEGILRGILEVALNG